MAKVKLYSSNNCGYCHKAKAFFRENGVDYELKDVDNDRLAQSEMLQMRKQGVPVIVVGDEIIEGFNLPRLEQLFGKKVVECPKCRAKLRLPRNKGKLKVTCKKCSEIFIVDSNR